MRHLRNSAIIGMAIGIFAAVSSILLVFASSNSVHFEGIYGELHSPGIFNTTGNGGNAGLITFMTGGQENAAGFSGIYFEPSPDGSGTGSFTGSFWLDTVGWATMIDVELTAQNSVTGTAWSDNAGRIFFHPQDNTYSGVMRQPGRNAFTGYAWSENLGYLSFSGVSGIFDNKVMILGNIGGNKAYDTDYALGNKYDSVNSAPAINLTRKNVALMTRNLQDDDMNTDDNASPLNKIKDVMYFKRAGANLTITDPHTKMDDNDIRTLVVEGGDIYISADITTDDDVDAPRAIIAIKDTDGNGGNIYIGKDVKNIYASLITEGSIYSGEPGNFYNETLLETNALPPKQLYIFGSVISRNTIGGYSHIPVICPYIATDCDTNTENALKYDWNFFRTFIDLVANDDNDSDKYTGYETYSVIIETDGRIGSNPPPGMTN